MPEFLLDPTLVYTILVLGMWIGVTAIYTPGTGLLEGAALLTLFGALWGLARLPTQWAAVIAILLGMTAFVLLPILHLRQTRWAEVALAVQVAGSLLLYRDGPPNLAVVFALMTLSYGYYRFMLVPTLQRQQAAPEVGNEIAELIGAQGRVVAPASNLHSGTAHINGELWTIRSAIPLETGDIVRVVDVIGLEVQVERVKAKRPPTPDTAEPAPAPNGTHSDA